MVSAQTAFEPLPPIDSLTDWQVNELTQKYLAHARYFEQVLSAKSNTAASNRAVLENDLQTAQLDSMVAKAQRDSISGLLKMAKKAEKTAVRQQQQATKTLQLANETAASDNIAKRKSLPKLWKESVKTSEIVYPPAKAPMVETAEKPVKKPKKDDKKKEEVQQTVSEDISVSLPVSLPSPKVPPSTTARTKKYDPTEDVMLNPPALPCQMAVDTRDEFSGEQYRRTAALEIFRTSPPALKTFLQGKPNVLCEAALTSSGANAFLNLTFTITDPNPRKAFGKIEKGSLATLKFMDGSLFNLNSQQLNEGVQNLETQVFVFQAQYPLQSDVLKKLRRTELDKVRIAWSSGYEDYDVQYVQLLMGQAKCLFE